MNEDSRVELIKLSVTQTKHYKRMVECLTFLVVTLLFSTLTFMNPYFMTKQLAKESNYVIVDRQINKKFNNLANVLEVEKKETNSALLNSKQTQPMARELVDYVIGLGWFKTDNSEIAHKIKKQIYKFDSNVSSGAIEVQKKLKKCGNQANDFIIYSFNLNDSMLLANLHTLFLIINVVVIITCVFVALALLKEYMSILKGRSLIHLTSVAISISSLMIMLIFILLAALPLIFNVESWNILGLFLEIASGIFLELVFVAAILFVISTVISQVTSKL